MGNYLGRCVRDVKPRIPTGFCRRLENPPAPCGLIGKRHFPPSVAVFIRCPHCRRHARTTKTTAMWVVVVLVSFEFARFASHCAVSKTWARGSTTHVNL